MSEETKIEQPVAPVQEKTEEIKVDVADAKPLETASETPEQINWRKFREEREKERRQLEAERKHREDKEKEAAALKAALEAITNKPQQNQQQFSTSDFQYEDESEEQRIEKKVAAAIEKREREAEAKRREQETRDLPNNLQKTFGDFNQTCTTENLDYLEFHYPEIANAYRYMPDGFDKWASIYKSVKKFVPNADSKKDAARADKNLAKPQSGSVTGVSQTGTTKAAMVMDDSRKAANWERMQRVMKGLE